MLFFRKKSPYLRDLIPQGQVDIHSHLIPGIDDGAADIEASLSLLSALVEAGYSKFIMTPHVMYGVYENTPERILNAYFKIKTEAEKLYPNIKLEAAAEYMLDSNFPNLLESGQLLPLYGKYLLVELSYLNPPLHLFQLLFDIQVAGYIPVLAHPERYAFYHRNHDALKKLKTSGCRFQINLLSVVGYYGPPVADSVMWLLREGMVDFVGSDVHHHNHIACLDRHVVLKDMKPFEEALIRNQIFG